MDGDGEPNRAVCSALGGCPGETNTPLLLGCLQRLSHGNVQGGILTQALLASNT